MPYDAGRAALSASALAERFLARTADGVVPSCAWAVFAGGRIVASGGSADEAVTPTPTLDTAFRIASCTKSFTAAATLQLRDAGLLDLAAPVSEYLPLAVVPSGHGPTVLQLASMAAGLPTDDPWGDRQESMSIEAFDALAAVGLRLAQPPGTRFEYSNLGFSLLGRVLELVSGQPYRDLVRERLLEPLGLSGVAFDRDVPGADRVVDGFHRVDGAWQVQPWAAPGAFSPMAGVVATPRALATWAGWLAAAWDPGASDLVLAAASRRELQTGVTPIEDVPGLAYGLGLIVLEDQAHGPVVSHSGGYPGFGAHMRWHPGSGIGIVVLENARYSGPVEQATAALTDLLEAASAPGALPDVWHETLAAREVVEGLLRGWDDAAALALFADNVELDEPVARRREHVASLVRAAGLDGDAPVLDLLDAAPESRSAAHLVWRVRGRTAALRCEIQLTPERQPRVQTLTLRLG